jgi:tetratricopeptide (TPR) repeat protein
VITAPFLLLAALLAQGGAVPSTGPARAVVELQEAIRKDPGNENHYTDLGNLLLRTQNFEAAITVLEYARPRFPESAQVPLSLGVAYYGQRRFADAIDAFLQAAKLAPDAEQPHLFLGRLLEHAANRMDDVKERFSAFAKAQPDNASAHLLLGKAIQDAGELRKAIALDPRNWEAHFELGGVLEQVPDYPAAIAEYEKAAMLAPKKPEPPYRLFRLYSRTRQTAKAEAARSKHEALAAAEKAEVDRRQAEAQHMKLRVEQ